MTKTITGTLAYRKQYALQCMLKGTNSRARDNCFEMGDGDQVMVYIMRRATEKLPDVTAAMELYRTVGLSNKSPEYKLIKKHDLQKRLLEKLKRSGTFDYWTKLIQEKGL